MSLPTSDSSSAVRSRFFETRFSLVGRLLMGVLILLAICCAVEGIGCRSEIQSSVKKPAVLTTVEPLAFLIREVAGDKIDVVILVPAGREPETFAPNPTAVQKMARCQLFFRVGIAAETPLLPRLRTANPEMKIVDLRENHPLLSEGDHHHSHSGDSKADDREDQEDEHGEVGESHETKSSETDVCGTDGIDPHLWMSPSLATAFSDKIAEELSRIDPENRAFYENNGKNLSQRLVALHQEIQSRLEKIPDRTLYVFHPAYGYYCVEFKLTQRAIEVGGKSPKPRDLADWIRHAKEEKIRAIIVQPEFSDSAVQAISESLPVHVVVHSPLEADYFQNLRHLTDAVIESQPKAEEADAIKTEGAL